ncbi:RNA-guided endonuclease InsQ/TnpB family protein [Eubacterium ramulus]|uniref:RNA-guided endonuclease InsQ/TnpB family protein n=1 Tax=Eubacterium ramulus TaxID=39490 RepID=UPI003F490EDD
MDYEDAKILGIDYAMRGMAVFSENIKKEDAGYFRKSEERLAREQRKLSRREIISGRKTGLHYAMKRSETRGGYFLHKLSRRIADEYDVVAVEDIDMKAMSQCMHFGKSVMDNGYGTFRELLEYKLKWEGKEIIRVDRFFPSSKKCCKCGRVKKELKLSDRSIHLCVWKSDGPRSECSNQYP